MANFRIRYHLHGGILNQHPDTDRHCDGHYHSGAYLDAGAQVSETQAFAPLRRDGRSARNLNFTNRHQC